MRNLGIIKDIVPKMVTNEENESLTITLSDDEIRAIVFSMGADSAPGPDGFNGSFYQSCLSVISRDICAGIKEFFASRSILENLNNNFSALMP